MSPTPIVSHSSPLIALEQVGPGQLPSFMSLYGDQTELPLVWKPFEHLWVTVVLALLVVMIYKPGA